MNAKQFEELKLKIDAYQSRVERLRGQSEEVLRALQSEFGVDNIEDAHVLLADLQGKYEKAEQKLLTAYNEFQSKYADLL